MTENSETTGNPVALDLNNPEHKAFIDSRTGSLYKFVHNWDVHYLLEHGSLKFGRLLYYALLEAVTGDDWIGDRREGNDVALFDGVASTPEQKKMLEEARIAKVDGGGSMEFSRTKMAVMREGFALCVSRGDIQKIIPVMTKDRPKTQGYDRYLQIDSLCLLIDKIRNATLSAPFGGMKCADVFHISVDEVTYESRGENRALETLRPPSVDFFLKDKKYIEQCEFRIILLPKDGRLIHVDAMYLTIDNPGEVFTLKTAGKENGDQPAQKWPTNAEKYAALSFLYRSVQYLNTMRGLAGSEFDDWCAGDPHLKKMADDEEIFPEFSEMDDKEFIENVAFEYWKVRESSENNTQLDKALIFESRPALKKALSNFLTEVAPDQYADPFHRGRVFDEGYRAAVGLTLRVRPRP